jgi:hypothetical protein
MCDSAKTPNGQNGSGAFHRIICLGHSQDLPHSLEFRNFHDAATESMESRVKTACRYQRGTTKSDQPRLRWDSGVLVIDTDILHLAMLEGTPHEILSGWLDRPRRLAGFSLSWGLRAFFVRTMFFPN